MTNAVGATADAGSWEELQDLGSDIERVRNVLSDFSIESTNTHSQTNQPQVRQPASKPRTGDSVADRLDKTITIDSVMSTINRSVDLLLATTNRASIVSKEGSGDWRGAQIEEQRRTGNQVSGWGSMLLGGAGAAASIVTGIPGLAQVGAGLGNLAGKPWEFSAAKKETDEAHSQNWERQSESAMQTAALLRNSGSYEGNTTAILQTFLKAAGTANRSGYSGEEGMHLVQQLAKQGLGERAYTTADQVFRFERGTGADRDALTQAAAKSARYGGGDILRTAYQGTKASGLEKGQFQEFLTGLERIFEEGIEKGFVKGAAEITRDLTFLSEMSGNDTMWTGEQGANRLSQMNSAVQNAVNLSSVSDIQTYRAARNLVNSEQGADIFNRVMSPDGSGNNPSTKFRGDSLDTLLLMERGASPELVHEQMNIIDSIAGNDRLDRAAQLKNTYGFNWTAAAQFDEMYQTRGKDLSSAELQKEIEKYQSDPGSFDSMDKQLLVSQKSLETAMAELGHTFSESKLAELKIAGVAGIDATVDKIYNLLLEKEKVIEGVDKIANPLFDKSEAADKSDFMAMLYSAKNGTQEERSAANAIQLKLGNLTNSQQAAANQLNTPQRIMNQAGGDVIEFANLVREMEFAGQANSIEMAKNGTEYDPGKWWHNQRGAVSQGEKAFFGDTSEITDTKVLSASSGRDTSLDYRARDWSANGYNYLPAEDVLHKEFNTRVSPEMMGHEDFRGVFGTFFNRYANALEERGPSGKSINEAEYDNIFNELVLAVRALTQKMDITVEYSR
ncbi:hypothetical protein FACS1894164_03940 [Spirochaetia bacterium]|nr:hypothetical protein FACS1894164_03940 [Spirochaetia bacterium]